MTIEIDSLSAAETPSIPPPPEPQAGDGGNALAADEKGDQAALQAAIHAAKPALVSAGKTVTRPPLKADDEGGETQTYVGLDDAILASDRAKGIKTGQAASFRLGARFLAGALGALIFGAVLFAAYLSKNPLVGAVLFAVLVLVGALVYFLSLEYGAMIRDAHGSILKMAPIVDAFVPLRREKGELVTRLNLATRGNETHAKELGRRPTVEITRVILGQAISRNERLMLKTVRHWKWSADRKSGKLGKLVNFFDAKFAARTPLHFVLANKTVKEDFYSLSLPTGSYQVLNMIFDVNAEAGTVTVYTKKLGIWDFEDEKSHTSPELDKEVEIAGFKFMATATGIGHIAAICALLKDLITNRAVVASRTIHGEVDEFEFDDEVPATLPVPAIGPPPPRR